MNIELYLKRIEYVDSVDITYEVLSKLQAVHLQTVPFENLDIQNGIRIDLSNLFDKIVIRRRGGFCYELNGLFYQLLLQIGFTVKMVSARVHGKNGYSPEFDHLALIVQINSDHYLVDVGFGEFALHPIKIEINSETNDPRGVFKIERLDDFYLVVEKKGADEKFVPEYIFSEKERRMEEFYERCNYHQTNPASHFVQNSICSLPTASGRITLSGNKFKITENGIVNESTLNNEEVTQALWNYFGIKLEK
jgi:N-hydroxyarylamine O-acetyltransferase